MHGVGHKVCLCWTRAFCVPCRAGWLLQPSRKAEKLYMKAGIAVSGGVVEAVHRYSQVDKVCCLQHHYVILFDII